VPPREPWVYGKDFEDEFRLSVELKYRLMPYIYAQAADCSIKGFPMLRTLFFEYPGDPTSWFIEDEYLFGSDILVAPFMEETKERDVYLPPGLWFDYQTGSSYPGGHWHKMKPSPIPCVILVKNGAALPHLALAQSTAFMDWGKMHWRIFSSTGRASGLLCLPESGVLRKVEFERKGARYEYKAGPPPGKSRHLID
jgi:alpha-D-xyloside xylohydrolase